MNVRRVIDTIRRSAERGAGVVEYALVAGLIAIASLGSMEFIFDTAESGMERSLNDIGTTRTAGDGGGGALPPVTPTTSSGGSGGGGGGGSTTSTTAPTTTSTTSTTISTSAPAWSDKSSSWHWGGDQWRSSASVVLHDASGQPLSDGTSVVIEIRAEGGSWVARTIEVDGGHLAISHSNIDRSRDWVEYRIVRVTDDDSWNGQTGDAIRISRPWR